MAYLVSGFETATSGYERIRSGTEIILSTSPTFDQSVWELRDELISKLDECDRPDDFNFEEAKEVIHEFFHQTWSSMNMLIATMGYDPKTDEDDGQCRVFLFLETDA